LQPPSAKRPDPDGASIGSEHNEGKAREGRGRGSEKRKIQRSKTLSSLIDSYLAKESLLVTLPEIGEIEINDLFVEINGQDLSNGITKRPSTYIPKEMIEASSFKRFNMSTLERISDGKPKLVFLLSKTGPYVKNGYINIWCEGLEYLDYRLSWKI